MSVWNNSYLLFERIEMSVQNNSYHFLRTKVKLFKRVTCLFLIIEINFLKWNKLAEMLIFKRAWKVSKTGFVIKVCAPGVQIYRNCQTYGLEGIDGLN